MTVNMTVNGVGYYRHEVGHPVVKTMEVSEPCCSAEESKTIRKMESHLTLLGFISDI